MASSPDGQTPSNLSRVMIKTLEEILRKDGDGHLIEDWYLCNSHFKQAQKAALTAQRVSQSAFEGRIRAARTYVRQLESAVESMDRAYELFAGWPQDVKIVTANGAKYDWVTPFLFWAQLCLDMAEFHDLALPNQLTNGVVVFLRRVRRVQAQQKELFHGQELFQLSPVAVRQYLGNAGTMLDDYFTRSETSLQWYGRTVEVCGLANVNGVKLPRLSEPDVRISAIRKDLLEVARMAQRHDLIQKYSRTE